MATKSTKSPIDKRTRLVDTAAKLVHEQGFNRTTLADISRESRVPLGNVYYYFRTKEAIGEALIDKLAEVQASGREAWSSSREQQAASGSVLVRSIPSELNRIFLHRLDVNQHPTEQAVFDLTIQEELGCSCRDRRRRVQRRKD